MQVLIKGTYWTPKTSEGLAVDVGWLVIGRVIDDLTESSMSQARHVMLSYMTRELQRFLLERRQCKLMVTRFTGGSAQHDENCIVS